MHISPTCQFADIGVSHEALQQYLARCGYWADHGARQRYQYVLSPSVYVVTPKQRDELERLARCTYAAVVALNSRLCDIGALKSPDSHEAGLLYKLANNASRGLLRPSDGVREVPPVIKVDLVQAADGHFQIAEVDVYNPRGLGFVALLEGTLLEYALRRFPGVAGIAKHLTSAVSARGAEWHIIVSEFERFYESSFRIFANAMQTFDIPVRIIPVPALAQDLSKCARMRPIVIPDTMDVNPDVRDELMRAYHAGEVTPLFPPVAYLGSKAFLPWLRTCPGMDEFIPPTWLVHKRCATLPHCSSNPYVLKATVSSGLKKVLFSAIDHEFVSTLDRVRGQKNPSWILQEQVAQTPFPVVVFDDGGRRETREYYLRVTAYINEQGIIDAEITGRPDRKVHGAPDCIMVPVVLG